MAKDTTQINANVTAVLHKLGRRWCVVAADMQGSKLRILAADNFGADESTRINTFLDKHAPGRIICALPASATICRTVDLPDVSEAQLPAVLSLQAEAHLIGIAPAHRMAMSLLPAAPGDASRSGLILAWPESAEPELPLLHRSMVYTGDVAGLAGIIGSNRPAEPLAVLDRTSGSIGIAMPHAGGIRYRAANENSGDSAQWLKMTLGIFMETALNAGHSDNFIESTSQALEPSLRTIGTGEAKLIIPPELMNALTTRVNGAKADTDWWAMYGIPVGVLLACQNGLEGLVGILREPPQEKPSRILQLAETLSRPRAAIVTVALCLLLIAIVPMLFTGLRLAALTVRHGDLQEELRSVNQAEKQLRMYELLAEQAWPMSKLLADLAASTPPGIELESIRITQGETINVSGKAVPTGGLTAAELIAKMQQDLEKSRVFNSATYGFGDRSKMVGSYEFDLTARVSNPHRPVEYSDEYDFITYTMQDRVDGKGPSSGGEAGTAALTSETTQSPPTTPVSVPPRDGTMAQGPGRDEDSPPTSGSDRRPPSRGGDSGVTEGAETIAGAQGTSVNTKVMPELLTEEQIAQMDRQQVMGALTEVATAKNNFRNDAEALEKLDGQFKMLMTRLREIN